MRTLSMQLACVVALTLSQTVVGSQYETKTLHQLRDQAIYERDASAAFELGRRHVDRLEAQWWMTLAEKMGLTAAKVWRLERELNTTGPEAYLLRRDAVKQLRRLQEQGNPDAAYALGQWYESPYSSTDGANLRKALQAYLTGARSGHGAAANRAAELIEQHPELTSKHDPVQLWIFASEHGSADAPFHLARRALRGDLASGDMIDNLMTALARGSIKGQQFLLDALAAGDIQAAEHPVLLQWILNAREDAQSSEHLLALAMIHQRGDGVAKSADLAHEYSNLAQSFSPVGRTQSPPSLARVSASSIEGGHLSAQIADLQAAMDEQREADEVQLQALASQVSSLDRAVRTMEEVTLSELRALRDFELPELSQHLATLQASVDTLARETRKGAQLLDDEILRAAQESLQAGNRAYKHKDYAAARQHWLRAAGNGLMDAHANLGILHAFGLGVEQDLQRAHELFALAVEGNSDYGRYWLAKLYVEGLGVEQDIEAARQLLMRAAANGHGKAKLLLQSLAPGAM